MLMENFFERFDRFYETSTTGTLTVAGGRSHRLARRWEAIVARNAAIFADARVLDIASHDGRWSLAALDAGARHVIGVEGRPELVDSARATFAHYKISQERYSFLCSDVMPALTKFEPKQFDLILNLGFFYHTARHYDVFERMYRLGPSAIILDTEVVPGTGPIIRFRMEGHHARSQTIPSTPGLPLSIIGSPNHQFIALMCDFFGYELKGIDWHNMGITDWDDINDYEMDNRRTYVLRTKSSTTVATG